MATVTAAAVFPVKSASAFVTSPAYSGTFIPTVWSAKLNASLYARSTFMAVANTNWEGDLKGKGLGDKVIIRIRPTISIADYEGAGSTLTYEVPVSDTIELQIDQAKKFSFQTNDVLAYQADINLMNEFSADAAEQMKIAVDTDCWAACAQGSAATNHGATAGRLSGAYNLGTNTAPLDLDGDNILETILAMASVLDEQNVPDTDRWLVLTPAERFHLMQSRVAQAYYTGDTTSPVRNGQVGKIDRFTLYTSNLLPRADADKNWVGGADAGKVARHVIVAGHKMAMTYAGQFTTTETLRNPYDFGDLVRGLNVYGRRVVKPEALVTTYVAG